MSDEARAKAQHVCTRSGGISMETKAAEDMITAALDAYAAEQTAAEAAKHADCCVDREELAALRADNERLRELVRLSFVELDGLRALRAAPEAAP